MGRRWNAGVARRCNAQGRTVVQGSRGMSNPPRAIRQVGCRTEPACGCRRSACRKRGALLRCEQGARWAGLGSGQRRAAPAGRSGEGAVRWRKVERRLQSRNGQVRPRGNAARRRWQGRVNGSAPVGARCHTQAATKERDKDRGHTMLRSGRHGKGIEVLTRLPSGRGDDRRAGMAAVTVDRRARGIAERGVGAGALAVRDDLWGARAV